MLSPGPTSSALVPMPRSNGKMTIFENPVVLLCVKKQVCNGIRSDHGCQENTCQNSDYYDPFLHNITHSVISLSLSDAFTPAHLPGSNRRGFLLHSHFLRLLG